MKIRNFVGIIFLLVVILVFFRAVFSFTKVPIPTDTLVNLFNPYRDYYASDFPRGVPYKNPLVGDPVLQQIPARQLSIDLIKNAELPLWNPYQMAGYPLLGNIQSAPFYPLNFIFLLLPFVPAWTIFIMLEQILAGIFMYIYLKNRALSQEASIFGGLAFSFCGFFIAWLEWGTIAHTALWIPLGLFAIDKILKSKKGYWYLLFSFSIICSFLAGHLQTFIYGFFLFIIYFLYRWWQEGKNKKTAGLTLLTLLITGVLLSPIWYSQLTLILLSARNVDLSWQKLGWFIPLAQLVQFFAPDFFGNPATGNYWGVFNYGEFIGYVGMAPLILAMLAFLSIKKREMVFWGSIVIACLLFATQNPIAAFPYSLSVPFFSSAQPTRLLVLVDVALVILAATGFETISQSKKKLLPHIAAVIGVTFIVVCGFVLLSAKNFSVTDFAVSKRNLIVPGGLFFLTSGILLLTQVIPQSKRRVLMYSLVGLTALDLLFFAGKYTPFADVKYYYPTTKALAFLTSQPGQFRIMTTTRQIFSPNIATMYHLQSIDGYDPLYLMRFGEMMAASERGKADISTPFGFNRIVVSNKMSSPIVDLLGVKYVLSLTERSDPKLIKVFEEGQTKIYENTSAFPRAFFVENIVKADTRERAISLMLDSKIDLHKIAIIESSDELSQSYAKGTASIQKYSPNTVTLSTKNKKEGLLVLTDTFYPTWKVFIDKKPGKIYRTDYNFRGVVVPPGPHTVEFRNTLL
jgi:uncharacterized membrane protein YfhO